MIIIGYPGIGKTTLAKAIIGKSTFAIDLESSCFWVPQDGKVKVRPNMWEYVYCNIAEDISKCGNVVFVSSHYSVRHCLENRNSKEQIAVCLPSIGLQKEWIKKLEDRYDASGISKDFRAWISAKEHYTRDIVDMKEQAIKNNWEILEITSMDYKLRSMIFNLILKMNGDNNEE